MAERRAIRGYIRCVLCVFLALSAAATDVDIQEKLLARIEALEEQGRHQAEKLTIQETLITDYRERVDVLEQTVAELQQAASGDPYSIRLDATAEPITRTPQLDAMAGRMHGRRALMQEDGALVAFHAVIQAASQIEHLGKGQKIVFPDIMLNLGGAYHNRTGVFIAPRHGLYLFSATITSTEGDGDKILCSINVNNRDLVGILAQASTSHEGQSSATAMTVLNAGDEVWIGVISPPDTKLWGGFLTSFTGCLIAFM